MKKMSFQSLKSWFSCPVSLRLFFCVTLVFLLFFSDPASGSDYNLDKDVKASDRESLTLFRDLRNRLIRDGFAAGDIDNIYGNPKVLFELQGVSLFFIQSESRANYEQFLSERSINSALDYIKQHKADLDNAESIYGVDRNIITAIMLVETRLGTYLGNRAVINILSTMSALSDSVQKERLWDFLSNQNRIKRDKFDKKSASKSQWAYNELKAFLRYTAREGLDPVEIKGSYAGALGISQFMPSNVLSLAKDGNLDGRVDLFNHTDAIHSIANYLKHHGWKQNMNREESHKILYKYNHSNPYVETLLKISERLKADS